MPLKICARFLLAAIVCWPASFSGQQLTFDQLAKASKIYFRDSAEFPMRIELEMTATDASGRVRKHSSARYDYDFHGYNQRSETGHATFHGPRRLQKALLSVFVSATAPISFLGTNAEDKYDLQIIERNAGVVSARMARKTPCPAASWSPDLLALQPMCGSFDLQVEGDDFALKHYALEAASVPLAARIDPFGDAQVLRYHADADFQKILLPGDPKPFLVPKTVTVVIETEKGKVLISAAYLPRK
jgi:hypothetical protein